MATAGSAQLPPPDRQEIKEFAMPIKTMRSAISHIHWWAISLMTGAIVLLAGAPAALAVRVPAYGGEGTQGGAPAVLAGGTPGWQIVLIAAGSALTACALTLLAVHLARRAPQVQPATH
jgi:hypothetical protein